MTTLVVGGSDAETMRQFVDGLDQDLTQRVSASLRLRLALLGWHCKNMRERCAMEVAARCAPAC
jgi:hypothetical protein